jgi:hypothetical protein
MKYFLMMTAFVLLGLSPSHARENIKSEPLTTGTSYLLSTHGVERRINIVLPADYDETESVDFRAWLSETVLPLIRDHYRDDGRAFLAGESAAGHFVAETWAIAPKSFDGYAALSPSLQWDNQSLSHRLAGMEKQDRPALFISLADEGGGTEQGVLRFVAEAGSNLCFADRRTELVHANTLHGLLPEALQYLLPTDADWLEEYGLTLRCSDRAGE